MPSVKGVTPIIVQNSTLAVEYTFNCPIESEAGANDGLLKYGTTLTSVTVTAKTEAGITDTELVSDTVITDDSIVITVNYPNTNGEGRYSLTFIYICSDGSRDEFDYTRIYVKDL